jgi:hypothetical protein
VITVFKRFLIIYGEGEVERIKVDSWQGSRNPTQKSDLDGGRESITTPTESSWAYP